jgi:hypothetical protein
MSHRHTEDWASTKDALESLYERCLAEIKTRLEQTTTLNAETFQAAAYAVRDHLAASMVARQEELNQVIETLVQQWQQVLTQAEPVRQQALASDTVQDWTARGVSLLAHLAGTIKTVAGEVESRLQRELEYHTGTVVGAGNFFCTRCDKPIQKVKTGPLPPCSRCHGTVFRRQW